MVVRPIRALLGFALTLGLAISDLHGQSVDASERAYAVQAVDVARQALLAELVKHPERVHRVSLTFSLQVDPKGRPHNVRIISKTHNPWAADVARQALSAAKYPPIPKKLVQAIGTDVVNVQGEFNADASR